MQALGANVYSLPVSELFTAAQTGMVKGTVTLSLSVASRKLEEVFRFCVVKPPFKIDFTGFAYSKSLFDKMPSEIRKLIIDSMIDANKYASEEAVKVDKHYINDLKTKGVTFVELTPSEWAKFQEKFEEVQKKYLAENYKALEGIMKAVKETR